MRRALLAFVLSMGLVAAAASPVQAAIVVGPYGLNFGPQKLGTASAPQRLLATLIAPATFRMGVSTVPARGISFPEFVPSPDFQATSNCPSQGVQTGSTSCTIDITFKPLSPPAGPRSATLIIEATGTYSAPLTGTAVAPPVKKCKKQKSRAAEVAKKKHCKKKTK
jgi:hypothetical protein